MKGGLDGCQECTKLKSGSVIPPPHSNGAVFYTFVSFKVDAKMQRLIAIDSAATITKL